MSATEDDACVFVLFQEGRMHGIYPTYDAAERALMKKVNDVRLWHEYVHGKPSGRFRKPLSSTKSELWEIKKQKIERS